MFEQIANHNGMEANRVTNDTNSIRIAMKRIVVKQKHGLYPELQCEGN